MSRFLWFTVYIRYVTLYYYYCYLYWGSQRANDTT